MSALTRIGFDVIEYAWACEDESQTVLDDFMTAMKIKKFNDKVVPGDWYKVFLEDTLISTLCTVIVRFSIVLYARQILVYN